MDTPCNEHMGEARTWCHGTAMTAGEITNLISLPMDIHRSIMQYLDVFTLFILRSTCRHYHGVIPQQHVIMDMCISHDRIPLVDYMRELRYPWTETVCRRVIECGYLDMLKYLHVHGCPLEDRASDIAAKNGHNTVLGYLHQHGCPWDERTSAIAAKYGQLETVRYLYSHDCAWNYTAYDYACDNYHLDVLEYLQREECPWNNWTYSHLTLGGPVWNILMSA